MTYCVEYYRENDHVLFCGADLDSAINRARREAYLWHVDVQVLEETSVGGVPGRLIASFKGSPSMSRRIKYN